MRTDLAGGQTSMGKKSMVAAPEGKNVPFFWSTDVCFYDLTPMGGLLEVPRVPRPFENTQVSCGGWICVRGCHK